MDREERELEDMEAEMIEANRFLEEEINELKVKVMKEQYKRKG
jgi:hypothetical protein